MSKQVYLSEIGDRLAQARWDRRHGYAMPDPDLSGYSEEQQLFIRKFVAHSEGGPHPDDPAATGELEDVPMPEPRGLVEGDDADL